MDAVFSFEQPDKRTRCAYHMRPDVGDHPHDGAAALLPENWVAECAGYYMVGLQGTVVEGMFVGEVADPACGSFALELIDTAQGASTAWAVAADKVTAWELAAAAEPAAQGEDGYRDVGCRRAEDFEPGRAAALLEDFVGVVRTPDECTAVVLARAPAADGAEVLQHADSDELDCFAAFGMHAIAPPAVASDRPEVWTSCTFVAAVDGDMETGIDAVLDPPSLIFGLLDGDESQTISFKELQALVAQLELGVEVEQELRDAFEDADVDDDGQIAHHEFAEAMGNETNEFVWHSLSAIGSELMHELMDDAAEEEF